MRILFLAIGSELLDGTAVETNSNQLASTLASCGCEIECAWIIRDDLESIARTVRRAQNEFDCVIISGGLGPTRDDLTIEGIARGLSRPMQFSRKALSNVRERLKRAGRLSLLNMNKKQAQIVEGAKILRNPEGTAPGLHIESQGCRFYIFPGVPIEFAYLCGKYLAPAIRTETPIEIRVLRCFPIAEADLDRRLRNIDISKQIQIGFRTVFPENQIKLTLRLSPGPEAYALLDQAERRIRRELGDLVFGRDDEELSGVVLAALRRRKRTLSVVESCTGGLLASFFTRHPGSSDVFLAGLVTYHNCAKIEFAGVRSQTLNRFGAVSKQCAREMAEGGLVRTGSDFALSITGIAGPAGGSRVKPVGTVFMALAARNHKTEVRKFLFLGNRNQIQLLSAYHACNWIRLSVK